MMLSIFECPHFQSRSNYLILSCYNPETSTETMTSQCSKDCLQLFDMVVVEDEYEDELEMVEDDYEDEDAGQWSDYSGEWASNEDGFFDNIYGKLSKQEDTGCEA